jgi:hypothetical protein
MFRAIDLCLAHAAQRLPDWQVNVLRQAVEAARHDESDSFSTSCRILKTADEQQIAYSVVLDPYQFDLHGDWVPPRDVEDTAHGWMQKSRRLNLQHRGPLDAVPVESFLVEYPTPADHQKARRNEPHSAYRRPYGGDIVHSGSWIIGSKINDPKIWHDIKSGKIQTYSIEGYGYKVLSSKNAMPEVNFIEAKYE